MRLLPSSPGSFSLKEKGGNKPFALREGFGVRATENEAHNRF